MRYQGEEYEIAEFDPEKYQKDMAGFKVRFPAVKGKMYNLDGKLETVPGYCGCGEKLKGKERRVNICTKCQLEYKTGPKVKVVGKGFVIQEALF